MIGVWCYIDWGYIKDTVYKTSVLRTDDARAEVPHITDACSTITAEMLKKHGKHFFCVCRFYFRIHDTYDEISHMGYKF